MCFQMTFAIITPALIAGAFAERMKFSAMLWFMGLWAIFVYAPVAHWVWGPDGIFSPSTSTPTATSPAGSRSSTSPAARWCTSTRASPVSIAAIMVGKRRDTGPGHNMVLTFIGAGLLWVGWFGFNAGSAVTAGVQAGMAMTVTQIATAVAALTWMFVEWAHHGKPTVIGIASGAVAGLVAITPASGFVGPVGSMVIGVACGVGCYLGATALKHAFGYDDALDCFGVHGVGGIIGALLTGVFAIQQYGGTAGLIEGNPGQVINQCIGIGTVIVYDAIVSHHHPRHHQGDHRPARLATKSSATVSTTPCTARSCSKSKPGGSWPPVSFPPADLGRPSGRPFPSGMARVFPAPHGRAATPLSPRRRSGPLWLGAH